MLQKEVPDGGMMEKCATFGVGRSGIRSFELPAHIDFFSRFVYDAPSAIAITVFPM